jgi:elongation factor G
MSVEIITPEDYMGDVMGDINRRRGLVGSMTDIASGKSLKAQVPLAEMFGYANDLRSMTQGRASYSMEFNKYVAIPNNVATTVIENLNK